MKVIDKTPYQDEKGNSTFTQRFQGMLDYGPSWRAEVEAQKPIIAQLERVLEKGYTLIRNLNLANSRIIEPLILIGPSGVFVLYVTPVSGFFEAKADEWNVVRNNRSTPASVNPMMRVARLARAVQVFLNRQGVHIPTIVEPVLIAANPGVHIQSLRPIVRVVLSDAIKEFAASLLQTRPILRPEIIYEVVDHLISPRSKAAAQQTQPMPPPMEVSPQPAVVAATPPQVQAVPPPVVAVTAAAPQPADAPQRARAIFHAAEEAEPFDPADLSFKFDEHAASLDETGAAQELGGGALRKGFSPRQWLLLVIMLLVEFTVLAGFVYMFFVARP